MTTSIEELKAWEILDSRGEPTVAARVRLTNGVTAIGHAPAGASTGRHEAVELRDRDPLRYAGRGVLKAVETIETTLAPALKSMSVEDPAAIDRRMIDLDGTPAKSHLGANAILAVSCAVHRALSLVRNEPLWRTLSRGAPVLPRPMVNILSGGLHAGRNVDFQDFLVIPHGFESLAEALHAITKIHHHARVIIDRLGFPVTGVADEGGWGPALRSNEEALHILSAAIEHAGYDPGKQFSIALDIAATHFESSGAYELRSEKRTLTSSALTDLIEDWSSRYPITSIEDPLAEDDWSGWRTLTDRLGARMQIIGDDLFTTNTARLERGIREKAGNAILVKMNQIGTITETFEVLELARNAGYKAIVSARSGETEDSFLADLAVASGAGQIKIGSITRSERLAKYNRLLEIEKDGAVTRAN